MLDDLYSNINNNLIKVYPLKIKYMREGYYIVNTDHGAFVTDTKDFIGNRIFHDLVWEPEIIKIYKSNKKKLIKIKKGDHSLSRKSDLKKICNELYTISKNENSI